MICKFGAVNIILVKFCLLVHPAAFIPCHESTPESCVLAQSRPLLLPLCKMLKEAARLRPDEVCIGWQRFQHRTTNESRAEAKRRLTWRTRQINSSKLWSRRVNVNLLLSDEDHFGAIVPCSHSLSVNKGARCSRRKFKRSLFPPVGLSPPAPLPSPLLLGRFKPFEAAPLYLSISEHTDKWVSLRYRLHASVLQCLWTRIEISTLA